jgi:redox-sensitive bicupin YhaK (pirin superfamily)
MGTVKVRRAEERGRTLLEWLDSKHSFSFGEYYDPRNMGFGPLRVINDDIVKAGSGFGMHGHRDMEIVTVPVWGMLQHRDSLGNGELLRPGEVQAMSAGSGIRHSEWNPSETEAARFIQIWIEPRELGTAPSYSQRATPHGLMANALALIASGRQASEGLLRINQDAEIYRAMISSGAAVQKAVEAGRSIWLQVITGSIEVLGVTLREGDGCAISNVEALELVGRDDRCDVLLFDLPS